MPCIRNVPKREDFREIRCYLPATLPFWKRLRKKWQLRDGLQENILETEYWRGVQEPEDLGFAKIDHHRAMRQGCGRSDLWRRKDTEQIFRIAEAMKEKDRESSPDHKNE